jgi:Kef-type K+ transport system membrane component KefB
LIFGALSSATAPAATVDVLAEYDAEGPLTTSLLAVVGLDDAMSLLLFSLAIAGAETILTGAQSLSILQILEYPIFEIGGSILLGVTAGLSLNAIMKHMKSLHDSMAISIGFVFLCVGLSETFGLSLILASMVMGITVVNRSPHHGKRIRFTIEQAGPVIYVLFFTLVGARLQLSLLSTMGVLGIAYVLLRSSGKFMGAWIGASIGGAEPAVRSNLGLGLLSQAGVAIGLALNCERRFAGLGPEGQALGSLVLSVITATTFIVQIIGPVGVKLAIQRAGEIGKAGNLNGWASEAGLEDR